jgi:Domain of unknown function (DUF4328)
MTDIWVCGSCHSINRQRGDKCYKCGATQAKAATGEMATLRQEQAVVSRTVFAYRPARALMFGAAMFLVILAGIHLASIPFSLEAQRFVSSQLDVLAAGGTIDEATFKARIAEADLYGLVRLAVVVPTLLFFAAWLSRVVGNVPALGGGVPGTSPGKAFVATLVPLWNLKAVPGTIQDVLYRLDPKAGGLIMVAVAWVGLVASWIVARIAGWYLGLRLTFDLHNAASLDEAVASTRGLLTATTIIEIATNILIAVGAIVLVMVMARIERRSQARDREIRAFAGV